MFVKAIFIVGLLAAVCAAQECGPGYGTCSGSECCSKYNFCGKSSAYCGSGCLVGYGTCTGKSSVSTSKPTTSASSSSSSTATSSSSSVPAPSTKPFSTNGQCQSNGAQCSSPNCCSVYGYCGTSSAYCGTSCQVGWGKCTSTGSTGQSSSSSSTSSSSSSSTSSSSSSSTSTSSPSSTPTTKSTTSTSTSSSSSATSTPTSVPTTTSTSTSNSAANAISIVTQCAVPGTVAITFDDGPYLYTADIVAKFNAAGGKVTFFMNGNNWGCIYTEAVAVKAAYDSGHQIGSHTWSHADLSTLNEAGITSEMTKLSTAFQKILGADPVYMRPPYGSSNASTALTLQGLGYRVLANWDTDSGDSLGYSVAQEQAIYNGLATGSGSPAHIILQHETSAQTAESMVPFIIKWANQRKLKMVTLGTCLGESEDKWYRNKAASEAQNPTWVC